MKMRKRCCFVFLCIFAAIYISGCGKEDRRKNDEDKLSVYLLEGSSFIEMIDEYNHEQEKETDKIEYTLFPVEDYENMYKKMTSELLAGEGPDIICFDSSSIVNIRQLINQNAFLDLSAELEDIVTDEQILEKSEGQMKIIPVSYSVPMLITTENICEKYGINIEHTILTEDELNTLSQNDIPVFADPYNYLYFVYERYIDKEEKKALYDNHDFRKLLSNIENWARHAWDETELYVGMNPREFDELKKEGLMFVMTDNITSPILSVTLYNQMQKEAGKELVVFGVKNGDDGMFGYAKEMVAINGNTSQKEDAVRFLKYLLSDAVQSYDKDQGHKLSGIPVIGESRDNEIDRMETVPYASDYIDIVEGVPEIFKNRYKDIVESAQTCVIPDNGYKYQIFSELLDEYKSGQINSEDFIDKLNKKTGLYLNE